MDAAIFGDLIDDFGEVWEDAFQNQPCLLLVSNISCNADLISSNVC